MIQKLSIRDADLTLSWSSDLRDLAEFWPTTDLPREARCYAFQCADFIQVWCNTIGQARKTKTFFVAVFGNHNRPLALFPLGIEVRHGIKILTFLDGGVSDYNAPILFPGVEAWGSDAVQAIWNSLRKVCEYDVAVLEKLPDKIGDLTNPLNFLSTSEYPRRGYLVSLTEKWDETASKRLPHSQDSRRQLKRLSSLGTVNFKIATTPEEQGNLLKAMIRQKSRRYLETRGTDSFDRPGYRAFFHEATAELSRRGSLHLSGLFLDDQILAVHWGYIVGHRYYYMMPSYEGGEWQRYSPGRLLLNNLLEWSTKNGMRIFDQGIGDEKYKQEYCDTVVPLFQIEISRTLRGHAYLLARKIESALRRTSIAEFIKPIVRTTQSVARQLRVRK